MIKQVLRWLLLGGTLFFLASALKNNWQEVAAIRIDAAGWAILATATGVTLLAHIWAGWVWSWIIKEFERDPSSIKLIQAYLKTNIAKYLPGNIGHYVGRIMAAKDLKVSTSAATISVLLEPLLMATAALIVVLLCSQFTLMESSVAVLIGQILGLIVALCLLHPLFLNPIIRFVHRRKDNKSKTGNFNSVSLSLNRYPLIPLLGEFGFLLLRACGFIITLYAIAPINLSQLPLVIGAFSFAWLLGLVVPGAPGGIGVFEATAIALLQQSFPMALIISASVLYRLISIVAETAAASLAWFDQRLF
ncbi:lysylphosphatidylglycerol synthase transmembrane domain-containing protein [Calothrix sp. CCY 0018]|uniref:lysylphosphatidylglycerol synthase transmembrane domain-containing protein n=1 Tax=Calothrix sp. CCY 0018 TaxID=3103864 RepID=UPI0039C5B058